MNIYLCGDATEIFHIRRSSWNERRPDNTNSDTDTPAQFQIHLRIHVYIVRQRAGFRHQLGLPPHSLFKVRVRALPVLINFIIFR